MTADETTENEKNVENTQEKSDREQGRRGVFCAPRALVEARESIGERVEDYNEKYFRKFAETGKAFAENLRKDASELFEMLVRKGKKAAPKLPFADAVEKKITGKVGAAASRLNIPSRDDVERLAKAVEALNEKVEGLSVGVRQG